jgi:hypothetical protein
MDQTTNQVKVPASYEYLGDETKPAVSQKIAGLEARIADALIEGDRIDAELAKAMVKSKGMPEPRQQPARFPNCSVGPPMDQLVPGEVRNNGPVAGTANPALPQARRVRREIRRRPHPQSHPMACSINSIWINQPDSRNRWICKPGLSTPSLTPRYRDVTGD